MNASHSDKDCRSRLCAPQCGREVGFSLVELLVVIVVITILTALTLGGVRHAMNASRRVMCANNLRWLYKGVVAYTNDHRGLLPEARRVYSLYLEYTEPLDSLAPYFDVPVPFYDEHGEVVTGQPWECPANRPMAAMHGLNYYYYPYEFIMAANDIGLVSRTYHADPSRSFLWVDIGGPHPGGPSSRITGQPANRMANRFDGAVGWWADLEPRLR